jgi:hypothetical protein
MSYFHTEPQPRKLYVGSGEVFIADVVHGDTEPDWKPLGILSALTLTANRETVQPSAVNGQHQKYVTKETEDIALAMQQLDPLLMDETTGNLNVVEVVTGAKVTNYEQILNKKGKGEFEQFAQQSFGEGSLPIEPENITVEAGGEVLNVDVDYIVSKDIFGRFGITLLADQEAELTAKYDYTPAAKITIHTGGKTSVTPKMVKIENRQADGRRVCTTYYKVSFTSGGALTLKDDNTGDLIDFNVTLQAEQDSTRPAGFQLKKTEFYQE